MDEAQAWLLARDCSVGKLFFHQLHYEGTPGLWHLVLKSAIHLHLPYISLLYISGAFAAGGVYVLLRYAPLPRLFRFLLPFTFYLQYQYAVVGRSYAMFAVSVFLLVWLYARKKPQPITLAIVAALTANECMHGALFAAGIFVAYLLEQRRRRICGSGQFATRGKLWLAAGILAVFGAFAFWTAFPATDNSAFLNSERVVSKPAVLKLRAWVTGIPIAPPPERSPTLAFLPAAKAAGPQGAASALRMKALLAESLLTYPISSSLILAYLFLVFAALFIVRYAGIRGLLPYLFLLPPMVFIHSVDHHAGLPLITLIGGMWMAWEAKADSKRQESWVEAPFAALFAVVVVLQIGWSVHALRVDHRLPYDGGKETAEYLKANAAGKKVISVDFMTVAVQPYFATSRFANRPEAYWTWSTRLFAVETPESITALNPDLVVLGIKRRESETMNEGVFPQRQHFVERPFDTEEIDVWIRSHYRETHRFCGSEIARGGLAMDRCNVIFERP